MADADPAPVRATSANTAIAAMNIRIGECSLIAVAQQESPRATFLVACTIASP
jgi:hypothetical protein